ncbi:uncharacterized protein LOC125661393 [Ostrea edulis]|uniref:uncharacterized protein LOC125661393 n=1 Tax=Ostrea edulis TaxID=37623 RepID=UPI0024AF87A5|nr:uncharacterized protein LOC125661393 [Ostrea edulis]
MAMERERKLTEAGAELFMDRCRKYDREIKHIQKEIDVLISTLQEYPEISDAEMVHKQIKQASGDFKRLSDHYVDFLVKHRSVESETERISHLKLRDNVTRAVTEVLTQRTQVATKDPSCDRQSVKSGSGRSILSSTQSAIIQKRAALEAAKVKMKYVEKQAAIMTQKAALEAEISLLEIQQETEALQSALNVMENAEQLDDIETESITEARQARTSEFIQQHFVNSTNTSVQPPVQAITSTLTSAVQPPVQSTDSTFTSAVRPRVQFTDSAFTSTVQTSMQSSETFVPLSTLANLCSTPMNENWRTAYQPTQTMVHSSPLLATSSQTSHVYDLPPPFAPRSDVLSQPNHLLNTEAPTFVPHSSLPSQPNPVTTQTSGSQYGNRYTSVNMMPHVDNSQVELCQIMTRMMARKDVVLSRLIKYNDSPIQYLSWKQTFKAVMLELAVTPSEELDLMIKWLGPDSSRQAECLKTASAGNHVDALHKLWDRLDIRYGSPELIEACLRNKLTNFPKLSNTPADSKRLYDLYDLLSEIQCVKANPLYSSVLAMYDSSTGVNQIVSRLPTNLQEKWSSRANTYKNQHGMLFPPFSYFVNFIYDMAKWRTDPSFQYNTSTLSSQKQSANNQPQIRVNARKTELSTNSTAEDKLMCPVHNTNHNLNQCRTFRQKPMKERMEILKKNKLCFRCCSLKRHTKNKCQETIRCDVCNQTSHPTGLHVLRVQNVQQPSHNKDENLTEDDNRHGGESRTGVNTKCTQVCGTDKICSKSCAKILQLYVYNEDQPMQARKVYALIDDQSNYSLGKPELFDNFDDHSEHINFTLSTCSGKVSATGRKGNNYVVESADHSVRIKIPSLIECSDIPDNRHEIPSPEVVKNFPHLCDLVSYIPPVDDSVHIELLIGRDVIQAHHVVDQRLGGDNLPYAHKLPLGWVVVGESCIGALHGRESVQTITVSKTHILANGRATYLEPCVNTLTIKENSIFEKTPQDERLGPSVEDELFISLMESKVTKDCDDRWTAPLPFRENRKLLPNNRTQALQRVKSLDRSLQKDEVKKKHVVEFMGKMFENGHAEVAPPLPTLSEQWYLPFFGIYHPKKPGKVRVVFDSSAVFRGTSLNDVLMKGPDLTNNLLGVLLRFRKEAIALTADVEHMFYNFKVDETHRNYLRFVWHENNDISQPLMDYRMTVHVFGNSPSPSVATFCLRKSVENADSDVRDFVCKNFYVDDGLISCPDPDSAIDLMKRTQKTLEIGGRLRLHKIVSNSTTVLQNFPSDDLSADLKELDLGSDTPPIQRSLGLSWDISTDRFVFRASTENKPYTRRGALSVINSLFDPIGFAAPMTLYGKLLLREMMSVSGPVNWDEELPPQLKSKWERWITSLVHLQNFQISRKYSAISFHEALRREVHIFSDASKDAIASIAYLKLISDEGSDVSFLLGKSKVSPVHGHTIPRLELCAAVLSIAVAELVKEHLNIPSQDFYYYTDSKIVLGYLSNEVRRFYVYVTNRVNRIRAASSPTQWYFIPTDSNPADIATRRINAEDLVNSTYLTGPDLLRNDIHVQLPSSEFQLVNPQEDTEVRPEISVNKMKVISHKTWVQRFSFFSSWNSLVRAIMFLKGFIRKLHNESKPTRAETEQFIVKLVQQEVYGDEINSLQTGRSLSNKSKILPLAPVQDENGILRVGGRLKHGKAISINTQPVIIPRDHHIAILLVRHFHGKIHHQGRHMTEGALRASGYWVIGGKRLVSSIIRHCVTCRKCRGQFLFQKMSDLPEDRLSPGPPFTFVGLDTFGPWSVLQRKTRGGSAQQKRWAIVFTCLVSRAVHLEVVDEMSSAAFINAYRRFVAIRRPIKLLRSDRGTNFVGAIQDLGIEAEFVEDGRIAKTLETYGTSWKFNPPHSSHFGGSWERMIGTCRRILDNMLMQDRNKLTHDSLVTLMAEVSAIVNSRPLLPISTDPENPEILSPSVLLTHKKGQNDTCPFPQFGTKDMLRSQWKLVQGLADEFWSKWTKEYISSLQVRRKWKQPEVNLNVGDIVLVREKDFHRSMWPMAIVTKLFPSDDFLVRKVEIKLYKENKICVFVRPVVDLVLLVSSDD